MFNTYQFFVAERDIHGKTVTSVVFKKDSKSNQLHADYDDEY